MPEITCNIFFPGPMERELISSKNIAKEQVEPKSSTHQILQSYHQNLPQQTPDLYCMISNQ
jgi:hypothetical protein